MVYLATLMLPTLMSTVALTVLLVQVYYCSCSVGYIISIVLLCACQLHHMGVLFA